MKKIIILTLSILLLCGCNSKDIENTENPPKVYESIMDYGDYKNIKLDNIASIQKVRFTVGGDERTEITESDEIEELYNRLSNLKVGEKTEQVCEDNTTVYRFNLKDGTNYSLEIECDWFIVNGNRYLVVK